MNENRCVMCGAIIPEGRMVCPLCERRVKRDTGRTVAYLRKYRDWEWMAANANEIIRRCDDLMLKLGGGLSSSPVDGSKRKREETLDECIDKKNSVLIAVAYKADVDKWMMRLTEEERDLLFNFYVDQLGIRYIMHKYHVEKSAAYSMCRKALEHLDMLMFG